MSFNYNCSVDPNLNAADLIAIFSMTHFTWKAYYLSICQQRNIRSIERFILLPEEERRSLLRTLTDAEYYDVMIVCRSMPRISLEANTEGREITLLGM